ncbi:hypothetical protein [Knoellia sp. Soil729]|uniref:hypothetical protein n=1 Tax=Knoellia sp. Soil729 TaxID=1736394 RepID=UPI0006F4C49C|nr:hypothetical protein [Knoellia sp. Soil729]KRE42895.1 hypothetical protein ASG74_11080 [Knoellia sp. Soil729]
MSHTPDQPEAPQTPAPPTEPHPPTQQWAATAPPAPKRSLWGDALSSTGGTVAVIVAGALLSLVGLLMVALVGFGLARTLGGDHAHAARAGGSGQGQMPEHMGPGQGGPRQMPPGQQRQGPSDLPGLGGALHGEAVLPGDGSASRAVLFQRGEVTEVTTDKLTVKSTDGFSATYTIGADSRQRLKDKVSTLATGDQVMVLATKDGHETTRILKTGRAARTN